MVNAAVLAANQTRASARAAAKSSCVHCGLPLPSTRRAELGPFCCSGCQSVHALIQSEGLGRYYELRGGSDSPPPELRPDSFAWLEVLLASSPPAVEGVRRLTLDVQGVHCAACVWLLQELWNRQSGALDLRLNPALGRAELLWRPSELDLRDYLRTVERFGYRFGAARKGELTLSRALVVRLGVCFAAALNVMIFSLCYYAGLAQSEGALYTTLGRWSFALSSVAVLAGGSLFFRSAWEGLRRGVAHLDLPIALGILLGYGGSVWAWIARGPEAAYFDTITIFIALMVLGRWLQERVLQKNRLSILKSDGVEDLFTRRRRGAELETVAAAAIEPGDELWILPGDLVPVEGTLLGAPTSFSLDWITGESRPRGFAPGELVPAGAFHGGRSPARLEARERFAASRLQALLGTRGAREGRERESERGWSRFASAYVAAVLLLAATGFGLWLHAGLERAVEVALSILVVTCPCALGLALPLANELAHSALRRRGIFLREPGFLRRVLRVRHVLFDKTGTLTRGVLRLSPQSLAELEALDADARAVLLDACARSLHPVSRCVHAALARDGRTALVEGLEVSEHPGRGLEIRRGDEEWRLGRREFALGGDAAEHAGSVFARAGRVLATIEVEEELKSDAQHELASLQREGFDVHLLSGDRPERVARVAEELGIPAARAHGALQPEEKARLVRELDRGDTWMVGDGINDAPAFDAAACAATPAVDRPSLPARADLFYLGDGVSAVRCTLHWARRLARVLRTNLVLAVAYNAVVVGLCLAGLVGPLTAAVLMPASSIVFLSLTTLRLTGRSAQWTS